MGGLTHNASDGMLASTHYPSIPATSRPPSTIAPKDIFGNKDLPSKSTRNLLDGLCPLEIAKVFLESAKKRKQDPFATTQP